MKKTTVKRKRLPSLSKLKKQADSLWSQKVRERYDNKCALCGNDNKITAHHWFHHKARGNQFRWNIRNGVALCYACHIRGIHQTASAYAVTRLIQVLKPSDYEYMFSIRNDQPMEFKRDELNEIIERLENSLES